MSKLIERMSVERVEKINEYESKYPALGGELLKELNKCEYWHYLSYEAVCWLNDVFGCGYAPYDIAPLFR